MLTTTDSTMPPAERLDAYEVMFFCGLSELNEFCGLPADQQRAVLRDALDLCAETGAERVGPFDRARLGELLRQAEKRRLSRI